MIGQPDYEDVERYLRTFPAKDSPKGFAVLLHLVLTAVENMRVQTADTDIVENAHSITDLQAAFLQQLLDGRAESVEWFKDYIGHSSQTGLL